ncbi:hypothetical protein DY000_02001003 [Brassica cretica]|uniref:non-specific serine/threonine protein kinase n=1 Tax=Brassica cretica TaxID=69181 RepID=A0ABQ7C1N6_BRACR|nr:hypothetical protein DY000_02001003 [Brassica cretica]
MTVVACSGIEAFSIELSWWLQSSLPVSGVFRWKFVQAFLRRLSTRVNLVVDSSTVWLAWVTQNSHYTEAAMDKIKMKQIAQGDVGDNKCVVKLLDHFKHTDPNGQLV